MARDSHLYSKLVQVRMCRTVALLFWKYTGPGHGQGTAFQHLQQSPNSQSNYRIEKVDRKLVLQQSSKTFSFFQ